jgi:hypothetical protein
MMPPAIAPAWEEFFEEPDTGDTGGDGCVVVAGSPPDTDWVESEVDDNAELEAFWIVDDDVLWLVVDSELWLVADDESVDDAILLAELCARSIASSKLNAVGYIFIEKNTTSIWIMKLIRTDGVAEIIAMAQDGMSATSQELYAI